MKEVVEELRCSSGMTDTIYSPAVLQDDWQREEKSSQHDDQLQAVHPGRSQESARHEVDRHDRGADERAAPERNTNHQLENRRAGEELAREQHQRSQADHNRKRRPHPGSVTE